MVGIISGLISMLGWGISDFLAAKSSRKIGNVLSLFGAQIISFSFCLIYFFLKFQTLDINNIPKFFFILLLAGFLYVVATLAFYQGLIEGQVSLVSPIGSSWAMITAILSIIFLKEILLINQIIAIILIILGIVLISINIEDLLSIKQLAVLPGVKEGLIAMFGWGVSLFMIVPASKALGWFLPIFISKLFTILFLVIYIILRRRSFKMNFQPSILALFLLIGLSDILAFFAYSFGVEGEYASIVAPIAASSPLVTVILAKIFLREKLKLNQILGIASVIMGLILISI